MLDCVKLLANSAKEMKSSTLANCWHKRYKEHKNIDEDPPEFIDEMIAIAKSIGGEGLDDMAREDLLDILVDEPLNNEEIFESIAIEKEEGDEEENVPEAKKMDFKRLNDELENINQARITILEMDPDKERSEYFDMLIGKALISYKDTINDLNRKRKQPTIDCLFAKQAKKL